MPRKVRREPKDREPRGKTKSLILLFLADNGEQDRSDISRYLKDNFNIVNTSNVKNHLQELVKEHLLEKRDNGKGRDKSYYLSEKTEFFKGLYNYLKINGLERDLLKSRYYQSLIESDDFQRKLFINLLKDSTIHVYELMNNEQFGRTLSNNEQSELDELFKQDEQSDINFESFMLFLKNHNIDELDIIVLNEFEQFKTSNDIVDSNSFILLIFSLDLIPKDEKPFIIELLKVSPLAIEFMVNSDHANPTLILYLMISHLMNELFLFRQKMAEQIRQNREVKEEFFTYQDFREKFPHLPISIILKPLYMYDFINDRLLAKEFSTSLFGYATTFSNRGRDRL